MVFDLLRMVTWLERCGVSLCYPPADLGAESQITAVRDPDGNLVELTELGPGWLDHLKTHRGRGRRPCIPVERASHDRSAAKAKLTKGR